MQIQEMSSTASLPQSRWLTPFGLIAAAVAALVAAEVSLNVRLRLMDAETAAPGQQEKAERWNADIFRAISASHWAAAIDWVWLRSLTDTSIAHVKPGVHPEIYYDLNLITDLDPAYFEVYPAGANLLAVIRNDGPGALDLLLKGEEFANQKLRGYPAGFEARYWPTRWQIPLLLAYVYLFELGDLPHAAERFDEASRLEGSPYYLKQLVKRLGKPGGQYEVGAKLLNFMMSGAFDDEEREKLRKKRDALLLSEFLFRLNLDFQDYLSRKARKSRVMHKGMEDVLERFLAEAGRPSADPVGGRLYWDPKAERIATTSPRIKVLGLE
jgi:hypothetical protein